MWTVLVMAGALAGLQAAQDSNSTITLKRDMQPVARGQQQLESTSFSDVVKRVSPSVVKITTQVEMRLIPQGGLGSGVIISQDGYIATNNHVVDGAVAVTVTLTDGREFSGKVIGRDEQTDIAVIKVEAEDLSAVTFADTSKLAHRATGMTEQKREQRKLARLQFDRPSAAGDFARDEVERHVAGDELSSSTYGTTVSTHRPM